MHNDDDIIAMNGPFQQPYRNDQYLQPGWVMLDPGGAIVLAPPCPSPSLPFINTAMNVRRRHVQWGDAYIARLHTQTSADICAAPYARAVSAYVSLVLSPPLLPVASLILICFLHSACCVGIRRQCPDHEDL